MNEPGPRTRGESDQIDKLSRFSEDLSEINKVRSRLENAGYGQQKEEKKKQSDRGPILSAISRKAPRRREEDNDVFVLTKPGFFASLFSAIFGKSEVLNDPKNDGKIKKGLLFLLKYKCPFVLDDNVISFVANYLVGWQSKLRPLLEMLYRCGWRTEDGRKILEPQEFNILGVCSRIAGSKRIREISRHRYNTLYINTVSNSFIYLYYQIIKLGTDKLLSGVQNALYTYISENPKKKLPHRPEDYINAVKDFFDGRVETNFILPLVEAVTGKIKTVEAVRSESKTLKLKTDDYKADVQMHSLMKAREESYSKKKNKLQRILVEETEFLDLVLDDLDHTWNIHNRQIKTVELSFLVMKQFMNNQEHIVRKLFAAVTFFIEYYRSVLTISIPARLQARVEYIVLFHQDVFTARVNTIIKLINSLKQLLNNPNYENFIEEATQANSKKLEFATVVGSICDIFMTIADVLILITTSSSIKKEASRPIEVSTLERYTLPFVKYHILQESTDPKKEEIYSINGKTVEEVINEIRIFCFNFISYFEPEMIISDKAPVPRQTLHSRIRKNRKYKDFLARMKNEQNLRLPDSIEDI